MFVGIITFAGVTRPLYIHCVKYALMRVSTQQICLKQGAVKVYCMIVTTGKNNMRTSSEKMGKAYLYNPFLQTVIITTSSALRPSNRLRRNSQENPFNGKKTMGEQQRRDPGCSRCCIQTENSCTDKENMNMG